MTKRPYPRYQRRHDAILLSILENPLQTNKEIAKATGYSPSQISRILCSPDFTPKVLTSPGHSFSDVARQVVSIINLASVRAIENMVGHPVHPLRFRANLYVEGWPAWHEFDLLDARSRSVTPGSRWSSGLSAAPPSTSTPTLPSAIWLSRRRCSAASATAIAVSMPK